jgi:hypothetical protein
MAANLWLSTNERRIQGIRKFLVESSFQDSDIKTEIKGILILLDQSLGEIIKLQREVDHLKTENASLKPK